MKTTVAIQTFEITSGRDAKNNVKLNNAGTLELERDKVQNDGRPLIWIKLRVKNKETVATAVYLDQFAESIEALKAFVK